MEQIRNGLSGDDMVIDTDGLIDKYLTFWTDGQLFGVPIADVVQIVGMQEITPIPEFPNYAKGIINLRGNVIPVIDVRIRLHKAEAEYNERTCIIVTNVNKSNVGFIVDAVDEVTNISENDISVPPKVSEKTENAFLTGIGKRDNKVILLLDTSKILRDDEIEKLTNI